MHLKLKTGELELAAITIINPKKNTDSNNNLLLSNSQEAAKSAALRPQQPYPSKKANIIKLSKP